MKEKLTQLKERVGTFWKGRTKLQKILMISTLLLLIIGISAISFFASNPKLVPLYSQLTPQETGQIKENLDQKGIPSEVTDNGTTVLVPEKQVNDLKVQLASEGIPKSGTIDYSFFKDKSSFGMTDNEFSVLERAAMQTELENLIKNVNGVKNAKVMITLPEESVWVTDKEKTASASVVLQVDPGYEPDQKQIMAMYTLVSKSVPNLPTENIVMTDQNFNYYDLNQTASGSSLTKFQEQMQVKKEIERNIQTQIQQMLATMMGPDKVAVSVSADVDMKEETREENLVEPVDEENMEGIRVSAEKITETYNGENAQVGGVPGTGENDVPGYPAANGAGGNGNYEKVEDRVNYDVNRIQRSIKESPYSIRDLGIQVMVEPPEADNLASLPAQTINDIEQILSTIVRTSISKTETRPELTEQEIQNKIYVAAQEFQGKPKVAKEETTKIPWWVYVVGAVLLVAIIVLVVLLMRRRRATEQLKEELPILDEQLNVTEVEDLEEELTEGVVQKKQLEKYAKDKPEDFARLLRTWLSEE